MKGKAMWLFRSFIFVIMLVCVLLFMPLKYAQADNKVPLKSLPAGSVFNFGPSDSSNLYVLNGYNWIVLDPDSGYVIMQQNLERYFNGWWPGYPFEWSWSNRFDVSYAPDNQYNIAYELNNEFLNGVPDGVAGPPPFSADDQSAILTHDWSTADELGQTHGYPATVNCKIGMISRDEFRYYTNNETFLGIINPQIYYYTRTPSSTGYCETFNVQGDKLTQPDLGYNPTNDAFVRPSMYLNPDTLVTVVPGCGETGRSTVSCDLPAVTSDGTAVSTITVTLRDCEGTLLKNRTVALTQGSGNSVITPVNAVTDNNGKAVFTVKDNNAETVIYTATDTTCPPNVRITQTATVTFLPADKSLSTVLPDTSSLTAGGSQTITVTLLDTDSNPMAGKQVSLFSGSSYALVNGRQWSDSTTTDINGSAVFSVSDNIAENVTFTALDMSDSLILTHTASVTFTPGAANKLVWHVGPPESGNAGSTFEVQPVVYLTDQYGNLVTGDSSTQVTLSASGGESLTGNTMTLSSGVASFSSLATEKAGTFTLTASGGNFSSAESSEITIEPAEVKELIWHTQPPANGTQGAVLSTKPVIYLYDEYGNLAINDNSTLVQLTTPDWRILGGEAKVKAVKGVATFDPVPESSGTFTMTAVVSWQVKSAPSDQISVSPAAPKLNELKAGTVVNFAGYSWIVLDPSRGYLLMQNNLTTYHGCVPDKLYLPFYTNSDSPVFDPENDKSIAYYLNNTFYNSLPSACRSSITAFQRWGIGSNDGQGNSNEDTAFATCKIGLISYSEYIQYHSIIDSAPGGVSEYWWTRTPRSSGSAWFVFYDFLGSDSASVNETIRPTLYLDPLLPLDGSMAGFPAMDILTYDASPVPVSGSGPTSATFALNNEGDTVAIRVTGGRITPPSYGDSAPVGSDVINPYVSGDSFNASDGDYVGFYEMDGSNKVVAFSQIRLNVGAIEIRFQQPADICAGGYEQLTAKLNLLSSKSVDLPYATWSSSDKSVATVSSTGLVRGISAGTATITVSTIDNLTATCVVTVNPAPVNPTTVSSNSSVVPVSNDPVVINVPSNVTNASLSTNPAVTEDSASVMLPQVTTSVSTAYGNVNLSIPNETQVTGPPTWDGKINLPKVVDTPGIVPSACRAIEVGSEDATLILSQPVRIVLKGQARNISFVGWIKNNTLTYIPFIGTDPAYDNPAAAVGVPGDGYLILGNDIVIWTKHFTTFVTYAEDESDISQPVTSTITGTITDTGSGNQVSNISAVVSSDGNGNNTVSMNASQAVLLKQPDGNLCHINDMSKISVTSASGTSLTVASDGTIQIPGLTNGTDNFFNILYDLGDGQKIIIETIEIKISSAGEVSLIVNLIDPYGIITDKATGKAIDGAAVILYYADTESNRAAGRTPGLMVPLPLIDGFKPNNNLNPQLSDTLGAYGFMVYPDTDYYITAEKEGYTKYTSPTISVGKEIVKWDFTMSQAEAPKPVKTIERIYGQDRIDTALGIAKAAFTGKVSNVILATSENYPDALAGSVLAYKLNAPVLLVGSSDIEQEKVLSYIKDNMDKSGTVYILGGTGAVGSGMEEKVADAGFKNIKRLGGNDRYETSVMIAEAEGMKKGTPVVIASGDNYPDALSVSSAAAVNQYPILLVSKDTIPDSVREEILRINPAKVYIIGLQGVISQKLEDEVAAVLSLDRSAIVRIGGQDRYATSLETAKYFNMKGDIVCAATGSNFPDALAGSVYAALCDAPIILTDSSIPDDLAAYIKSRNTSGAVIFGGEGAVSSDIEKQLVNILR